VKKYFKDFGDISRIIHREMRNLDFSRTKKVCKNTRRVKMHPAESEMLSSFQSLTERERFTSQGIWNKYKLVLGESSESKIPFPLPIFKNKNIFM
jgi:hypothetical protein